MSRLPLKEWWATYQCSNEFGVFETAKIIFADSEVVARKLAYDEAEESEIFLKVEEVH